MVKLIDDRDYEILLHDIRLTEGVKYIVENAEEVYYVEPGYKIFGKRLVGTTAIPVGIARDRILFSISRRHIIEGTSWRSLGMKRKSLS